MTHGSGFAPAPAWSSCIPPWFMRGRTSAHGSRAGSPSGSNATASPTLPRRSGASSSTPMRHSSFALIAGLLVATGPAAIAKIPVAHAATLARVPGMVSAADPRAAEAGAEMLRKGGSAVDAAFATLLALNVVEPESQGIGGGSYLVYSPHGATPITFDVRT